VACFEVSCVEGSHNGARLKKTSEVPEVRVNKRTYSKAAPTSTITSCVLSNGSGPEPR
jgi:hypothetical protein